MHRINSISQMQQWSRQQRQEGKVIGVVPTMGYLHQGHLSLIQRATEECDRVVTTIFVNPLQFGQNEDFERYPRDLERDTTLALEAGASLIFAPTTAEMYPDGFATIIDVGPIAERFEGAFRPGHFRGVATVVAKLFHITSPHRAYFGQKDYQQTLVISRMVTDLNMDVELRVLPTVREPDGLAMSSRNVYLSPSERQQATVLYRALQAGAEAIAAGERVRHRINERMRRVLEEVPTADIDYAAAATADRLEEPDEFTPGSTVVLLLAVRIGSTRLIDNMLATIP
jgi:pantoate--beta-alanine ligase